MCLCLSRRVSVLHAHVEALIARRTTPVDMPTCILSCSSGAWQKEIACCWARSARFYIACAPTTTCNNFCFWQKQVPDLGISSPNRPELAGRIDFLKSRKQISDLENSWAHWHSNMPFPQKMPCKKATKNLGPAKTYILGGTRRTCAIKTWAVTNTWRIKEGVPIRGTEGLPCNRNWHPFDCTINCTRSYGFNCRGSRGSLRRAQFIGLGRT